MVNNIRPSVRMAARKAVKYVGDDVTLFSHMLVLALPPAIGVADAC